MSEYIKYIVTILVLIAVLYAYINNYINWRDDLCAMEFSFKLLTLKTVRFSGLVLNLLNFWLYISGSFFFTEGMLTSSNVVLLVIAFVVGVSLWCLWVANNGFKIEDNLLHNRYKRTGTYDE